MAEGRAVLSRLPPLSPGVEPGNRRHEKGIRMRSRGPDPSDVPEPRQLAFTKQDKRNLERLEDVMRWMAISRVPARHRQKLPKVQQSIVERIRHPEEGSRLMVDTELLAIQKQFRGLVHMVGGQLQGTCQGFRQNNMILDELAAKRANCGAQETVPKMQ